MIGFSYISATAMKRSKNSDKMIFKISKTSDWFSEDNQPIEGAIKRPFEHWQTRTLSESEFDIKFGEREGLWRSKGKNHKHSKDGYCMRQMDDVMTWSIEINSLEELMKIVSESDHPLVITDNSLEIYDDYRE